MLGCGRGYYYLSRSFGLGRDCILSAKVVTNDSSILEVTDDHEHADFNNATTHSSRRTETYT